MSDFLFLDMDGTLIPPSRSYIPHSAMDAVREAQSRGILCFLCTGRSLGMAREYSEADQFDGVVFSNGGGIAYKGEIVETNSIPGRVMTRILSVTELLDGGYQLLSADKAYQNHRTREFFAPSVKESYPLMTLAEAYEKRAMVPFKNYSGEEIQKIDVLFTRRMDLNILLNQLDEASFCRSAGYFKDAGFYGAEITAEDVTKAKGVKRVIELYGSGNDRTWAIGDSDNDVEMMKACDRSAAVENASDSVKAIASMITGSTERNGVSDAIHAQMKEWGY